MEAFGVCLSTLNIDKVFEDEINSSFSYALFSIRLFSIKRLKIFDSRIYSFPECYKTLRDVRILNQEKSNIKYHDLSQSVTAGCPFKVATRKLKKLHKQTSWTFNIVGFFCLRFSLLRFLESCLVFWNVWIERLNSTLIFLTNLLWWKIKIHCLWSNVWFYTENRYN